METLTLRNVDDDLARLLRDRARQRHRSVEEEAVTILRAALRHLQPESKQRAARARDIAALTPRPQRTDTVGLLREERGL